MLLNSSVCFCLFVFFCVSGLLNRIRNLLLFVKLVMFASDVLCFFLFCLFFFWCVPCLGRVCVGGFVVFTYYLQHGYISLLTFLNYAS